MNEKSRGFGLTEAVIGLCLTALLVMAAYRLVRGSTDGTMVTSRNARTQQQLRQFLQKLDGELKNAVPLFPATAATQTGSLAPTSIATCSLPGTPLTPPGEMIPSGLIPFPMRAVADMPADLGPLDPTEPGAADSDGARIIFFEKGAAAIEVLPDATLPVDRLVVADGRELRAGDFALVIDSISRDLFRVTGVQHTPLPDYPHAATVLHEDRISAWNGAFMRQYGADGVDRLPGGAVVQKVKVVDYAYDPATKAVVRDDHTADDGFSPASGGFGGPPGLPNPRTWLPVLSGVERFRISYKVRKVNPSTCAIQTEAEWTRTPRALWPSDEIPAMFNQLGYPLLLRARADIEMQQLSNVSSAGSATILSRDTLPRQAELVPALLMQPPPMLAENLQGPLVHITPNPFPTPCAACTPVPTPPPTPTPEPRRGGSTGGGA